MTLKAPKHLRGKIGNHRIELLAERAEWIRQVHRKGYTGRQIGTALGLSDSAGGVAVRKAGCARIPRHSMTELRRQGITLGPTEAAYESLSIHARCRLADHCARTGKHLVQAMADFWEQHHGEADA